MTGGGGSYVGLTFTVPLGTETKHSQIPLPERTELERVTYCGKRIAC
jgi:hypothetical protein